jgi:hypothetical protein
MIFVSHKPTAQSQNRKTATNPKHHGANKPNTMKEGSSHNKRFERKQGLITPYEILCYI